MELLGPIFGIAEFIGTSICQCLEYHRQQESLDTKLEGLNSRKKDIDSKLKKESPLGKVPTNEVNTWLKDVERINKEISLVRKKKKRVKYLWGACLGKQVEEMIKEVDGLKSSDLHDLTTDEPTNKASSTTKLVGKSAENNLKEILNCLIYDEVREIGVYGMGGVGKTTIMQHVKNELLKKPDKFHDVIWVTVGQLDVAKLQNDIATELNAKFSKEEDLVKRAEKLSIMLRRRRYVLILDDLRQELPLLQVGIPKATRESGCKLMITTPSFDVCRSMDRKVQVKPLFPEEALELFRDEVGCKVFDNPTLHEHINLIVEQCAGLPLAIVTTANNMKDEDDVHEWRNALSELRGNIRSFKGWESQVFGQLQVGYDHLNGQKVKYCFLYCVLFPSGFEISREELIECWIDEGYIEDQDTRRDMNDRGHVILNSLEKNCLLERVEDRKYVKMHNLFRAMALRITSESPRFMVKVGKQLQDLPPEQEWRDIEKVSLIETSITEIPQDMSPECQKLSTLLLQRSLLKKIPDSFFAKMIKLEILDLSNTEIGDLPTSTFDLKDLTALLLEGCKRLRHVPDSISKLQALKKLVLRDTSITEVPQGMAKLKNLRYLDLRTDTLKEMPAGLLLELSRLQHLTFDVTSVKNTVFMKGKEVAKLRKLETFEGNLHDVDQLNIYVNSLLAQRGPNKYRVQVGENDYFARVLKDKFVSISGFSICGDSLLLPTNIQQLNLSYCDGVRSLSNISSLKDATELRCCGIGRCEGIECVFSLSSSFSCCTTPLQSLEELWLDSLENLRVLIKGGEAAAVSASLPTTTVPIGTFSLLRIIRVYNCPKIKKLFSPGLLRDLQNLEEINVSSCDQMEEIIADDEEENHKEEGTDAVIKVTLPKFRRLILWVLPELKSICSRRGVLVCDSLQQIEVIKCLKLKKMPFSLPPLLKEIRAYPKEWWESVEWDQPKAKDVLLPLCDFSSLRQRQAVR